MKRQWTADPYRELGVIDARAPRFNQATIGTLALLSFLIDWWPLLAILAAQFAIGLRFGRRYCLPCLAYFELVQPIFGEGPIEDAHPPRFSNMLGLLFLSVASIAHAAGATVLGWTLGLLVAGLALLAATTGICAGCEVYKLAARIRSIHAHTLEHVDLAELGLVPAGESVVQFTHPLCTDCQTLARKLEAEGHEVTTVDVSKRPELARKYGVAVVPTAVLLAADGTVQARLAG
jgi:hypothetical protein